MPDLIFVYWPQPKALKRLKEDTNRVANGFARLRVKWWSVGQGLFMSGHLQGAAGGIFDWVYDCGTSDGANERNRSIKAYRRNLNRWGRKRVDLVTLSHFDEDHINGIVALLKEVSVGMLLLPYAPLWKRLMVAFSEGISPTDELFEFYMNPSAYLSNAAGGGLSEIVFVPEARPGDAALPTDSPVDIDRPIDQLDVDYGEAPPESAGDPAVEEAGTIQPSFLKAGGRIIVPSLWEFVPYNDPGKQSAATLAFHKWVFAAAKDFCAHSAKRKETLKELKRNYLGQFGAGSENANVISLYLYSGPIGESIRMQWYGANSPVHFNEAKDNFAQLNTGDAYLDNPVRLAALQAFYLADRRLERAGLFQVMHHGSRHNWFPGLAAVLKPAASIFSSHVPKHGHPDPEVLWDFWPWGAARVDKNAHFTFWATLSCP